MLIALIMLDSALKEKQLIKINIFSIVCCVTKHKSFRQNIDEKVGLPVVRYLTGLSGILAVCLV